MFEFMKSFVGTKRTKVPKPNFAIPTGEAAPTPQEPTALPHAEPSKAAYPIECLTPKLFRAAEAIARLTQGPNAIAAQSVLSVASLAVASRAKVQTLGSPSNASSAFVTVALSGERKSAADKIGMAGVDKVVMTSRKEHENAMAAHKTALSGLGRGEEKPAKPVCPNFLVTESTIEGAFKFIASGTGFLGWFTDEAAAFWGGHSMSKDERAKTSGILSKLWDGSYFFRPRATQEGDGYVPPTATTINLMFQPTLIRNTYGDEFLMGQGILARMLPCWPESKMGTRQYQPATADDRAAAAFFQDEIEAALNATLKDPTERMLTLSEDALEICIDLHDKIEAEIGPGGWASDVSSFASKAPEHACRLAAIMTLFEDRDAETISAEVMQSACTLVKYYLSQFKYLCVAATNETEIAHAQSLLDWLLRNLTPGEAFATDRLLQFGPVHTRRARALDRALGILNEYGWINDLPPGTLIDGKKRRKAYQLSPKVHQGS